MDQAPGARRSSPVLGVGLLLTAGVLFVIGAFVTAATVIVQGRATTATLWDGWEGKAALIVGLLLLAAAGVVWEMRDRLNVRAAGAMIAIVGIAATIVAIAKIAGIESEAIDSIAALTAAQRGVPAQATRPAVQALFDSGAASVSTGVGLYLVVIAGLVTVAAGAVMTMARTAVGPREQTPAATQRM
ncbi:MAG TPA: hypothetical protein VKA30_06095 [Actinomycetota bacterium]|nr:hypothetical protein [Actinomycetota bacterium]